MRWYSRTGNYSGEIVLNTNDGYDLGTLTIDSWYDSKSKATISLDPATALSIAETLKGIALARIAEENEEIRQREVSARYEKLQGAEND